MFSKTLLNFLFRMTRTICKCKRLIFSKWFLLICCMQWNQKAMSQNSELFLKWLLSNGKRICYHFRERRMLYTIERVELSKFLDAIWIIFLRLNFKNCRNVEYAFEFFFLSLSCSIISNILYLKYVKALNTV